MILEISSELGPDVTSLEIAAGVNTALGGLETTHLPELVANKSSIHHIELPLAGPLLDEHLEAIAAADPYMMMLSYASALPSDEHHFAFTGHGWGRFKNLWNLSLTGGALHHTWGLGNIPLTRLHLSHCNELSLAGLQKSATLECLSLTHPDLQHTAAISWLQQLKDIPSLRRLTLEGPPVAQTSSSSRPGALTALFTVKQLEALTLTSCHPHDDEGLWSATPYAPHLTALSISGSMEWPLVDFDNVPNLACLNLTLPFRALPTRLSTLTKLTS